LKNGRLLIRRPLHFAQEHFVSLEVSMESSTSLNFKRDLQHRGLSAHGSDWIQRALHPAGSSPVAVCVPDDSRVPTVCMDFRPVVVIHPPTLESADELWDCAIWCPPGDNVAAVYGTGAAGADFNTLLPPLTGPVNRGVLYTQETSAEGPFTAAPIWQSVVASIPVTHYNNRLPTSKPVGFRTAYRSVTASLTASSLNNQGTVFSTQLARGFSDSREGLRPDDDGLDIYQSAFTFVTFSENDLNLLSPSTETRPAKEGVYMPLRLTGPSQVFVASAPASGLNFCVKSDDGATPPVFTNTLWELVGQDVDPDTGNVAFSPKVVSRIGRPIVNPAGGADRQTSGWAIAPADTGYDNCSQGIIIFRGLSQQATITLQCYVGLEMIPRQDSPVRTFVRNPMPPDLLAIKTYYDIANSMAVSYPARYNSLGALLPYLVSAFRAIGPYVPMALGYVRDVLVAREKAKAAAARPVSRLPQKAIQQKSKKK